LAAGGWRQAKLEGTKLEEEEDTQRETGVRNELLVEGRSCWRGEEVIERCEKEGMKRGRIFPLSHDRSRDRGHSHKHCRQKLISKKTVHHSGITWAT
jgi:SOS response regulatory protein OraA/RecX